MSRRERLGVRIIALTLLVAAAAWPRTHGHAVAAHPATPLLVAAR